MRQCLTNRPQRVDQPAGVRLLALLLTALWATAARGQFFEFDRTVEAPQLDDFTYSAELIGTLESEIAALIADERDADPVGRVVIRASVNVRIITADLLAAGDAAGPTGSQAVLYGVTLADGRDGLDESLARLNTLAERVERTQGAVDPSVEQRFTEALRLVKRFNELAVDRADSVRTAAPDKLRLTLPAIFMPLSDAIAELEQEEVVSHWVAAARVQHERAGPRRNTPNRAQAAGTRPQPTITELSRRVEIVEARDDVRQELQHILEFLRRGAEFPELRPQVELYQAHIAQVLDLADALAAAPWIGRVVRDEYADRIRMGVLLFKDPRTRERGQRYLDRLEASRAIIDRITAVLRVPRDDRPDLTALIKAFLTADAKIDNAAEAEQGRRQLERLSAVLDRMTEYRELEEIELRRELRIVMRQLQDSYEASERALIEKLDLLSGEPEAMSDPAFASLMADQQQYLDDLIRIRRVPGWMDRLTLIAPDAAGPFYAQARKMTAWLLEPNRRPDATRAMEQFEQQLDLFYPLPFESDLSAGSPQAIAATGGLHERLLRHVHEQRGQWADAWGDGNAASPAAQRLMLLYRLLQTMADTTEVLRLQDDAVLLNRWSGWETTPQVIARAISDLPARLKLATSAAIEGNDVELQGNLNRIDDDMPLAKLMGRFSAMLSEALAQLPDGAPATCGQIVYGPTTNTWFVERLPVLADICRYALEQEYARAAGRQDLAGDLRRFVNRQCDDLLALLGDQTEPIPSLIGFDGSDPMPDVKMPDWRTAPRRR